MELQHFSHPHPLILKEKQENNNNGDEQVMICYGCEEAVVDTCYTCDKCNFNLHKNCTELPTHINHHLHPQHPLFLLAKPPLHYSAGCVCDFCDKRCNNFVYHCSLCEFDLDIICALSFYIFESHAQHHQFVCLKKPISLKSTAFTCNACGRDGDEDPYLCHMCGILVHKDCISLRRIVNSLFHPHPITHTYLLKQNKSWNLNCGICQIEVKTEYGCYNCPDCNFIVHVDCINTYESNYEDKEELEKQSINAVDDFLEPTTIIVRQIQLEDEVVAAEIKHFSHQHNLILIQDDNSNQDHQICDGCMLPINPPFYGCTECNFFLDESCIKLPRRQQLLHHSMKVHMTLLSKSTASVDGIFHCWFCENYSNGFVYNWDDDPTNPIQSDVRCVKSVFNSIKHESHEHPLFYAWRRDFYHCSACDSECREFFTCASCNFILDIKCATLPYKQRHRFDKHPLFLTYDPIDDGSDEYYCDICEMRRDPKFWVYYCKQCDFAAHPDCINKNPFLKLGGTFTYDIHPYHPLTLVQKSSSRKYPPCHSCGEPCDDLALECTVSGCKFIVHRKKHGCFDPYYDA